MIIEHYGHLAPDYQDEAALPIGLKQAFWWPNWWPSECAIL